MAWASMSLKAIALLAMVAPGVLLQSAPLPSSGTTRNPRNIQGGELVSPVNWPFITYINIVDSGFCTGTLIHQNWVLTAAHCVVKGDNTVRAVRSIERGWPSDYEVNFGIGRVIPHPDYDFSGAGFRNDIALVELLVPFDSPVAKPIEVVDHALESLKANNESAARMIGHGVIDGDASWRTAEVRWWLPNRCRDQFVFQHEEEIAHDRTICAGDSMIHFTAGDSGSPLLIDVGDDQVRWAVLGVGSIRGRSSDGYSRVSVYTRVAAVRGWISQYVQSLPENRGENVTLQPQFPLHEGGDRIFFEWAKGPGTIKERKFSLEMHVYPYYGMRHPTGIWIEPLFESIVWKHKGPIDVHYYIGDRSHRTTVDDYDSAHDSRILLNPEAIFWMAQDESEFLEIELTLSGAVHKEQFYIGHLPFCKIAQMMDSFQAFLLCVN